MTVTLSIYNSLSRQKEIFKPLQPGKVGLYVCGMTVYDYCHVGHARVMVVFDVVVRYLRHLGYQVRYVRNITDIDDKIIKRAQESGENYSQLTERFIQAMHADATALGVLPPDEEPRASCAVADMVALIAQLMANGYAYQGQAGDVYFDVGKFPAYGKLSGRDLDKQRLGARVEVDHDKRHGLDFVLWKAAKPDEPCWSAPWGQGRPGWHIECSAMSMACLGSHFDIHGGGMDLKFPHHENEIAQSEAATGQPYVNYWMHNGFVMNDQEKMSKSLGNFFTVREVLTHYQPEEMRYFILSSHYRSPLNYSQENLSLAKEALTTLYLSLRGVNLTQASIDHTDYMAQFHQVMNDDFNTPEAIAVMFEVASDINKHKSQQQWPQAQSLAGCLLKMGHLLGVLNQDPETYLKAAGKNSATDLNAEAITQLIEQRQQARQGRDFKAADRIRDELLAQGILLEDGPAGTVWRRGG